MRVVKRLAGIVPVALVLLAYLAQAAAPPARGGWHADVEARVEALLRRMTLAEKLGQLQQLDGFAEGWSRPEHAVLARAGRLGSTLNVRGAQVTNALQREAVEHSRLGIPLLYGFDVVHGYRTIFPIPLGLAAMWDPTGYERAARIAAFETRAVGLHWTFAPMVDVARDPRWGRIAEGAGEDPYLGSRLARAQVLGYQGDDPGAPGRVLACAKHFVAYGGAEAGRDYNTVDLSERALREIHLPPFKAAVDAGVGTLMTAFNDVSGVPATANAFTLTDVLRGEWGFRGFVVSDYTAIPELRQHGIAVNDAEAARAALRAGVDMEMVSRLYAAELPAFARPGTRASRQLDEAVRRVLRIKLRLGLFEHPYVDERAEAGALRRPEHVAAARELAARTLVLLRNEGGLLPLPTDIPRLAVIGPLADDAVAALGPWSGDGHREHVTTLLAALRARLGEARVDHVRGCDITGTAVDEFASAARAARQATVALVVVGESADMSGEAASRSELGLPGRQLELVQAVQATGTPTVVVLMNGRPLTLGWIAEHVPAVLETWFAGTESGPAIADVLFGDVNPGGKLPVTFPRALGQVPIYHAQRRTGRPPGADKYTSKYLDVPVTPLYPFGHGLSYTTFALSNLRLSATRVPVGGRIGVQVDVRNSGTRAGDEVVQLYLTDVAASVTRPRQELRGFTRTHLQPGESRTLHFELGPAELGLLDRHLRFVVEPGAFQVRVGTSSEGGLEAGFEVVTH